jgi:hypothetical protein
LFPVAMPQLYADVLRYFYSFCDAHTVMRQCARVSRTWYGAARTSHALQGSVRINVRNVIAVCAAPLRTLFASACVDRDAMPAVTAAIPWLHTLVVHGCPDAWPVMPHLIKLTLRGLVTALPSTIVELQSESLPDASALAACTRLRVLRVSEFTPANFAAVEAQLHALRSLPLLEIIAMEPYAVPYRWALTLYELPCAHQATFQTFLRGLDDDAPRLIAGVPGDLSVVISGATCALDFITPRVTRLVVNGLPPCFSSANALFELLARCTRLTALTMVNLSDVNQAHFRTLARAVPGVETLVMRDIDSLQSLDFLAAWPLRHLTLYGTELPLVQADHVLQLPHLKSFSYGESTFDDELPEHLREALKSRVPRNFDL